MAGSFAVEWLVDNRVISVTLRGTVTLDVFKEVDTAVHNRLETGTAPVFVVAHIREAQVRASPFEVLKAMRFAVHPKLGRLVIVGPNQFARFVASVVFQLRSSNVSFAESEEGALNLIHELDRNMLPL